MSDELDPECTPNAHHELREKYAHLAVGHHPDCSCILCGLRKMAGFVYQSPPPDYRGRWPGSDTYPPIPGIDTEPLKTHVDPVWRGLSDSLIIAREDDYNGTLLEQLWAKSVGGNKFMICCIPGFAYGLSIGDIVEVDDNLLLDEVVTRSNRTTFRVISHDGWYERIDVLNETAKCGIMELLDHNLMAIDVEEQDDVWRLRDYLVSIEEEGVFVWESGYWAAGDERPDHLT